MITCGRQLWHRALWTSGGPQSIFWLHVGHGMFDDALVHDPSQCVERITYISIKYIIDCCLTRQWWRLMVCMVSSRLTFWSYLIRTCRLLLATLRLIRDFLLDGPRAKIWTTARSVPFRALLKVPQFSLPCNSGILSNQFLPSCILDGRRNMHISYLVTNDSIHRSNLEDTHSSPRQDFILRCFEFRASNSWATSFEYKTVVDPL